MSDDYRTRLMLFIIITSIVIYLVVENDPAIKLWLMNKIPWWLNP